MGTASDHFAADLEKARAERKPVMALRHDHEGDLDDVVVEDVTMFRAEMMSERELWMACYFANGERICFWATVTNTQRGRLGFSATEGPSEWCDWDTRHPRKGLRR